MCVIECSALTFPNATSPVDQLKQQWKADCCNNYRWNQRCEVWRIGLPSSGVYSAVSVLSIRHFGRSSQIGGSICVYLAGSKWNAASGVCHVDGQTHLCGFMSRDDRRPRHVPSPHFLTGDGRRRWRCRFAGRITPMFRPSSHGRHACRNGSKVQSHRMAHIFGT
jgi:hypothetical protein